MSDEDATFEPPRAAIPSRAISGTVPHATMPPVNALPPVQEAAPRKRRVRKTQKLPAREIKRINTNRRKNLSRAKIIAKKKAGRPPVAKPAKNPNRPLELKTRMGAVLTAVASMSKNEAAVFTAVMQHMEDMSRSGRRHVISALGQVYG